MSGCNNMLQKVLIVKLAAIGDVIMALPMAKQLREKNPDVEITWMCGKAVVPILREVGTVDEIIPIDDTRLLTGNIFGRLRLLLSIWVKLFGRKYDLAVIGHSDSRYRLLTLTVKAKIIRSFSRTGTRVWPVPGRHHSDEYYRLVTGNDSPQNAPLELPVLSLPLPDKLREKFQPTSYSSTVAFAPGGAKNVLHEDAIRRWPIKHYVSLAEKLIENDIRVVLTGAPDDAWVRDSFDGLPVIDFIGETNLIELIALYHACDVVVTHDSGPLHLAGLAGIPLVALFGPTNPYEKVPRDKRTEILWGGENLACRPCYDGRAYADCCDNLCLKLIKPETVFETVTAILKTEVEYKQP